MASFDVTSQYIFICSSNTSKFCWGVTSLALIADFGVNMFDCSILFFYFIKDQHSIVPVKLVSSLQTEYGISLTSFLFTALLFSMFYIVFYVLIISGNIFGLFALRFPLEF